MSIGLSGSWSPSPATRPLSTVKKLVARYVGLPDDADALDAAKDALNSAVAYLNHRAWEWAKTTQTVTLVTGTATYTLNSNFKAARACLRLNSSSKPDGRLDWEDPKILDIIEPTRADNGTPRFYTVYNAHDDGLLTLIPAPDSGFTTSYPTLRLSYYKRVPIYVVESDHLDAPIEVEEFVIWYARAEIAGFHDPNKVRYATERWRELWNALVRDHAETHDWRES